MNRVLPVELESGAALPAVIQGYVSVNSKGGTPLFEAGAGAWPDSAAAFHGTKRDFGQARKALESMGFTLLAESRLGLAVAGPPGAYEELTGGRLRTVERLMQVESGRQRYVTHVDVVGEQQPMVCGCGHIKSKATRLEGVLIERPRALHGIHPSPLPPTVDRFHLRVPDGVALGLNAVAAHRAGHHGDGVSVAMVDTGQYAHPYFAAHRYNVRPALSVVPGTDPGGDPVGHGTGESANIFAVAPNAELHPIRASDNAGRLVGAIGGFLRAKQLSPAILTNSWGGDGPYPPLGPPDQFEIAFALEILDAVEQGIFVVFSAGNGQFTIEPQVPGVFAAGGVYLEPDFELRASDYASGYPSPWIDGVTVPSACGLVGLRPRAQYLMLPIPPGCEIDVSESLPAPPVDPNTDGTAADDGWALFSGTSAAAPQAAGAAALILGARPGLTPAKVHEALTASAVDVRSGRCHPRFGFAATPGHDRATGAGLIDAAAAVDYALATF